MAFFLTTLLSQCRQRLIRLLLNCKVSLNRWKLRVKMKGIILASVVLAITGCSSTDHVSFGAKRAYSYNFINDGSKKAEECQLECQKKETQCKQLAATEYQTSVASATEWWAFDIARHIKETRDEQ
jgi:hypothetical protein